VAEGSKSRRQIRHISKALKIAASYMASQGKTAKDAGCSGNGSNACCIWSL